MAAEPAVNMTTERLLCNLPKLVGVIPGLRQVCLFDDGNAAFCSIRLNDHVLASCTVSRKIQTACDVCINAGVSFTYFDQDGGANGNIANDWELAQLPAACTSKQAARLVQRAVEHISTRYARFDTDDGKTDHGR